MRKSAFVCACATGRLCAKANMLCAVLGKSAEGPLTAFQPREGRNGHFGTTACCEGVSPIAAMPRMVQRCLPCARQQAGISGALSAANTGSAGPAHNAANNTTAQIRRIFVDSIEEHNALRQLRIFCVCEFCAATAVLCAASCIQLRLDRRFLAVIFVKCRTAMWAASAVLFAPCLFAQSSVFAPEYHHFTGNVGAGYTAVTGHISNYLTNGWNFQAGADYHPSRFFSIGGTFMFDGLGVKRSALNALNMPNGNSRVYTVTVDPKIYFPFGRSNFYLLAGGGWMRRTVEFTKPVVATTYVFDPWWGYIGPALVPANQVIGSVSDNAGVWDVGGGFNFHIPGTRTKFYVEARYFDGLTSDTHTQFVPLTFGFRF